MSCKTAQTWVAAARRQIWFMVITIRLIDWQITDSDDPHGRAWYGYDPDATPEQLRAHHRGDWYMDADRIASERWAALNYQGRVVLVAELDDPGYELLAGTTGTQRRLSSAASWKPRTFHSQGPDRHAGPIHTPGQDCISMARARPGTT